MRHNLAVMSCVVMGCAAAPEPAEPAPSSLPPGVAVPFDALLPGEHEQGIYILGKTPDLLFDGTRHYSVNVKPIDLGHKNYSLSVSSAAHGANLVATSAGNPTHTADDGWFTGTVLSGFSSGQVRIESGSVSDGTNTRYHLSYRASISAAWIEYCGAPDVLAIPLRGWYDGRRIHHDGDTITFSCDNGVGTKCTLWGYPAGNAGPGAGASDWDRHQACTLAANASYCVDGSSGTREETPILVRDYEGSPSPKPYDLIRPDPLPGDPDTYYLESSWAAKPLRIGPVCLSQLRWEALPPDPCPPVLPDPRTEEGRAAGALYCDEMSIDDLAAQGAVVFIGSKLMDAPLHVWRNPTSKDVVTTIQGYYATTGQSPPSPPYEEVAPFPGSLCMGTACSYREHLGIDSMVLRNLPGTLAAGDMVELHMWERPTATGSERVVGLATAAPGPGFVDDGFEGYTFQTATQVSVRPMPELKLCQDTNGYYSTIGTCAGPYVPLGYAMPPP